MRRLFTDDAFRAELLQHVQDPDVREFWDEHRRLSPNDQEQRTRALSNRLRALFLARSLVKNIVRQQYNSISFRRAITNRELIFVKLNFNKFGEDARLIGTMLVAQLQAAVFSFADVPESQRLGVSIFVDEFATMATRDFSKILAEGRKYGARLVIAHQERGSQLPDYLHHSTATARTKICFRVTADDAREMAHYFPNERTTLAEVERHVTKELIERSSDYPPAVRLFAEVYLKTVGFYRKHGEIEIEGQHLSWRASTGMHMTHFSVPDPMSHLDALFYEVMQTGNPNLPIPWDAIAGFSNCGRGFFTAIRFNRSDITTTVAEMPAHLVVGGRWRRAPESGKEQYWHCIFYLRQTMAYLAEHPIGKEVKSTKDDVARMLMVLPQRAAFIHSGDDTGTVFTYDTPGHLTGDALRLRLETIIEQTRQKYCHPREEVERSLLPDAPNQGALTPKYVPVDLAETLSPWEEV